MLLVELAGVKIPMPPRTTQEELDRVIRVYATGSYFEIVRQNAKELSFNLMGLVFFYPRVLGLFLCGLAVWRSGIVRNLGAHVGAMKRWAVVGLLVGVSANAAWVAMMEIYKPNPMIPSPLSLGIGVIQSAAVPALSLFYVLVLALLFQDRAWQGLLRPFGAVGRTALSNYLLQSIVCTAIFCSWGLGLYGKVDPLTGLVLGVVIYALQVPLSVWWLRRHAFGPMEWVWRRLTYGRLREGLTATAGEGAIS
jgi:uncharacterized protein